MEEFETINNVVNESIRNSSYITVIISSCIFISYTLIIRLIDYFKSKNKDKPLLEMSKAMKTMGENITKLNEFVYNYLKEQKHSYELQKQEWEQKKKEKETLNEKIRNNLYEKNQAKRKTIDDLTKKIQNYREANNHLEEVAAQLNYTNFGTIHTSIDKVTLPPINPIPEKKGESEQPNPTPQVA